MQRATGTTESATLGTTAARQSASGPWRRCAAVLLLAFTLAAQELAAGHAPVKKSEVAWVAAPVVAVPIAAEPQVARPTAALGTCDFAQRFLVANEVSFQHSHLIAIALFGGLYGS